MGGEVTYYAKWTRDESYIKFVFDNDNGTGDDKTVTGGTGDTMKDSYFPTSPGTKTNYRFDGWKNGNTTYTSTSLPKFPDTEGSTLTVTAQWVGQSHITFDPGAGAFPDATNNINQTGDVNTTTTTAPSKDPTRTGYTFGGWSATNGGTDAVTTFTFPNTLDGTTTYYAIWTPEKYTVTWNGNGGGWTSPTATTKTEQWDYDSVITTYATQPTRTYYDFNGWYTDSACTAANKVTFDENGPKVTGNLTYYAGWTQKTSNVTVTLHVDGAEKNPGRAVVVGFNGGTETIATTATKVTFTNVPQRAAVYPITVEGVAYGNVTVPDATNGSTVNYTVDFATAAVTTNGKGSASVEAKYGSMSSALTATSSGAEATITVLKDQNAVWKDGTPSANYSFSGWDDTTNKSNVTVKMGTTKVTHNAVFSKSAYNTYLVVNVNKVPQIEKGAGKDIKEIQLVTANNGTTAVSGVTVSYDSTNKVWAATGVASANAAPYWRVTTVDNGVYYAPAEVDDRTADAAIADCTATMNFFGVKVVETKPTGCLTATVKGVSSSSTAGARVVTTVGDVTAAETHSNGYTLAAWKQTADSVIAKVTISGGTVTLASDYTYAADLEVTPTYTFSTTIETRHLTATGTLTNVNTNGVELKEGTNTVTAVKQTANGTYLASGLDPAKTYDIWVNGFKVGAGNKQVTSANANGKVPVVVFKVTTARDPSLGGTSNVGLNAAGSTNEAIVPNGAKVTADAPTVNAAATTATGYRKRSAANDGAGNTFWTASAGTVTTPEGGTGNTTTWTIASMTADVTLTAHYVRQYEATVSVDPTTGGTAEFTAKGSNGTVIDAGKTSATVDSGDYVKAEYTPSVGNTLKNWTFTGGTLWTTSDKQTGTQLTSGTATTEKTVYFFPTADNAKLTAKTEAALYEVEVAVNLDNGAYKDAGTNKVQVKIKDGTKEYDLTKKSNGVYTVKALPGDYDIYVNGLDISKNVAAAAAFDTAKNLNFSANDAEGKDADGNPLTDPALATAKARLKKEINYYTVVLKATPPTDTDTTVGGHVAFAANATSSTVATVSKIFLAHETAVAADTFNIGSEPTDAASAHFRFEAWSKAPATVGVIANTATKNTTYTLPVEATLKANTNITKDTPITLTASFVKQLRVTVELASGLPTDGSLALHIKKTGDTNWIAGGYSVLVDEGRSATFGTTVSNTSYAFSEWTLKAGGAGTFDNGGHSNATAEVATDKGYLATGGSFAPTKDSVLVLNAWQKATLEGGWRHDKGDSTKSTASPNSGFMPPKLQWTANDAQADGTPTLTVKVKKSTEAATAYQTLAANTDYSKDADGVNYNLDVDNYLFNLDPDTVYDIVFEYKLGPANHPNQVDATASSQFTVVATKNKLTRVDIQVSTATTATTANPSVAARDEVIYKAHTVTAVPTESLDFTWYYADSYPTQQVYTNVAAAQAALPTGAVAVPAANVSALTVGGKTIDKGTSAVIDDMKGKYVFAIVTTSTDTSEGTVITNAIPVDYDATITLKKDGSAVTDAAAGNYKVYLWPTDGGTFNKATAIEATHVAADGTNNGVYTTKNAALDATKSYHVYVNDVEDATVANHSYVKADNTAISRTNLTKTVNYYSVNLVAVTAAKVTHAKDKDNNGVGESFAGGYPTFTAAVTGTNRAVASGNGVLSGTAVTATSATWIQDYTLTWQRTAKADNSSTAADLADTSSTQSSGATAATYSNGAVTAKTFLGGRLDQNTYAITGDVKDITSGSKNAAITAATLTVNGHTFNGTFTGSGKNNAIVTFTVPRSHVTGGAVNAAYNLTATPAVGTTMKGYTAPASATAPATVNASVDLKQLNAGTTGTAADGSKLNNRFTIFIEATNLSLQLKDDDDPTQNHDITASGTATPDPVTHTEKVIFANYNAVTKKITLTNKGNADLKVTPTLEKSTNGGTTWSPLTLTGGKDAANGIAIADLPGTDTALAVGGSHDITVTIPVGLENSDDVQYKFTVTSKDGRTGQTGKGPKLIYILNIVVDPVHVSDVTTSYDSGTDTYTMATTVIQEDIAAGDNHSLNELQRPLPGTPGQDPQANDDLVYKWYYADWDATVELRNGVPTNTATNTAIDLVTGMPTNHGLSYKPTANERGKALYLVVTGQNNATGAAMTPDRTKGEKPIVVSYGVKIVVNEDNAPIGNNDDDGYQVYLWRQGSGNFNAATAIKTTFVGTASDPGVFKTADNALWPCETNADGTAKDDTKWVYDVYANIVKGTKTYQKVPGLTVSVGDTDDKVVDYYKVTVTETTYDNVYYNLKKSNLFFGDGQTGNTGLTPEAKVGTIGVNNGWVQKGNDVTLTEKGWKRDYTLAWTNATRTGTDTPNSDTTGSTATITNLTANTTVDTKLTLNLYNVLVYAEGTVGSVGEVVMALQDGETTYSFYAKAAGAAAPNTVYLCGLATPLTGNIEMHQSVTFRLPKANGYVVTGTPSSAAYNLEGYRAVHNTGAVTSTLTKNVTGNTSLDVVLAGSGYALTVADDVDSTHPPLATNERSTVQGTASVSGDNVSNPTVTQTLHLNYNYGEPQTVKLTVSNTSKAADGSAGLPLSTVTATFPTNTWGLTLENNGLDSTLTDVPSSGAGSSATVDLVIPAGLTVGTTYTYAPTFTFTAVEDGGDTKTANVTYTLKVVIDPLPFTAVSTKAGTAAGTYTVNEYTVKPIGADPIDDTTNTDSTVNGGRDVDTNLNYNTDYAYKWVTSRNDVTLTSADLTWNSAAGTVTVANSVDCTGTGKDTHTYTPNADDQGRKLYLVVYAKSGKNASEAAISAPITQGYNGIVYINVDGNPKNDVLAPNPGYTVKFISGSETVTGTWQEVTAGKYAYVGSLTPGKDYTVKVSRFAGDTADATLVTLDTLNGADIGTTTDKSNVTKADYFTVTAKPFADKEYQTGTGEDFTGTTVTPAFKVGAATVTSGTPVLKDQTVDAKTNTWTQDYKATWQSDSNTANVSVAATTADKGSQQTSAAASTTGYSQTITAKTFIGGRLDQNTYTVTGSIKGNTGSVRKVELEIGGSDTRNFVLSTAAESGKISAGNSIANTNNDGVVGNQGDTITFTVVKGVYDITAFDGPNTTIQKVTINSPTEVDTDKTRNKETLTPAVTADGRVFTVYVEDSALALGVTDGADMTKGNHAVSSGTATNLGTTEYNHKFADNVQVHYFNATTGTFDLKLNNSGNTDLVLSAPAVYKLDPGDITPSMPNLKGVTLGTAQTLTGGAYTDDNLTISGLVDANTALAVGATKDNAGKVTLKQTAANKDDAIYVIAFPSTYTDSGTASHDGPTVYYVVDLTVDPLPIKQVTAEVDATKTDGTLRLKDFVASGTDANDGLNSVLVDHDGVSTTANKGAKDAGLAEGDISYVWVTAPTTKTKAQVEAALTLGATAMTSSDSDVKVTAYTGKTCTPTAAEQGLNFYLVAFRTDADKNASEFAVSNAVYAQVVISMEARRTGTTDKLTVVKIASGDQTSNDGKVTVAAAGTNVPFTADNADNATPADATYYFVNWAADPTGGITVNGSDRLKMSYAATQQATVIGYYDLLPTLTGFSSYNIGADRIDDGTNAASYRTLTYAPNDGSGSGKVEIWVTPAAGSAFQNGSRDPRMLTQEAFETIAGAPMTLSAPFGGAGTYVLTDAWICGNLVGGNSYTITFYDVEKGQFTDPVATANATGYAGYDRSKLINITSGEKTVIARVEDTDPVTDDIQGHGKVQVKGKTDGAVGLTSTATTKGGSATVIATPAAGYVFDHWTMIDPADGTGASIDNVNSATTTVSSSTAAQVVVEASFRMAQVGVEGGKAAVFYGDNKFDGALTPLSLTGETSVTGLNWTYAKLTGDDLTDYLTATTANGGLGMSATDAAKVAAKMTASNAWLDLNATTGVFSVNGNATGVNVEKKSGNDVDNELVVYVKVTENATKQTFIVPFTVDIKTSPLKIVTVSTPDSTAQTDSQKTAEGNAYRTNYGSTPNHDDKVLYEHFHYTNVQNGKNAGNIVDLDANHANHAAGANPWDPADRADNTGYGVVTDGYWTVAPTTFDGTGANEYIAPGEAGYPATNANSYTFTYHYTGATDTAEDDYNYTNATIDMVIPVLVPEMSLKFADTLHTTTVGGDPAALTLTAGTHSAQDGTTNVAGGAPLALAYAKDANRTNEHITYLDEEPVFHVTLQKIGGIQEIELTMEDVDGFTTTLPRFPVDTNATTESKSFDIKLSHMLSDSKLWAGTHTITVKAKGYTDLTDRTKFIEASYKLEIVVDPKVVTSLDVTATPTRPTPASVTGTQKDSPADTPLPATDPKGNKPIKNSTATWTPTTDPTQVVVTVEIDPNYKYDASPNIEGNTELVVTGKPTPAPTVERTSDTLVTITQPIPYLMHGDEHGGTTTGPRVNHTNGASILVGGDPATLGTYIIDLGAYGAGVFDVDWTIKNNTLVGPTAGGQGVGATLTDPIPTGFDFATAGSKQTVTLDLTGVDTTKAGSFVLKLEGVGVAVNGADRTENNLIKSTYTFTLSITSPGGGGIVEPPCPCKVFYMIGMHGTTGDPTIEDVSENGKPAAPPTVTALEGYVFKGWSLTNPATLKEGEKAELVDPKTVTVKGEAMTFYAVLQEYVRPFHQHYVIGYPNGTFGPADDINRASVATIIARAVLPGFVEGADYGNPGGYSDVEGHWAESAIAYCSKFGVFEGMPDGTFQPDRPITRQELAVAVARLDGIMEPGDMSFTDIDEAGDWAMGGIYTAYTKGWVNGYPDGSFKPLNNIRRDETVKLFNAYLNRGVDAEGLSDLKEYVHSGVASNNTENGVDEYMTWPDVPKDQWAYYEIIEAANDHEYRVDDDGNYTVPEHWDKCWIDERWRYGDDPAGAAANAGAVISAGFRVWFD